MITVNPRKSLLKKNSKFEVYSRNPIYLWMKSCISYVHISTPLLVQNFCLSFLYTYYNYFTAKTIFSTLLKGFNFYTSTFTTLYAKFYNSYLTNRRKLSSSPPTTNHPPRYLALLCVSYLTVATRNVVAMFFFQW